MESPKLSLPDYRKLIDDEVMEFIHQTQLCFPDDTTDRSIEEQREIYNSMCSAFSRGRPEGVSVRDDFVSDSECKVPVRRYTPENIISNTIIIYIHGGGFVVGDLNSHDDVCAELCVATGFQVTSIDYRLSPENKHPAAFDDCLSCVKYEAVENDAPVLLCGDSAGGNLAAAVAQHLSTLDDQFAIKLVGQVLIYPELGGDTSVGSYVKHAKAPMLNTDEVSFYLHVRVESELPQGDASFAPLQARCFAGLPESVVISAECDPLSDDGKHYCEAIVNAGGQATWINEPGLVHGFLRARHSSKRAKSSYGKIVAALIKLGARGNGSDQ